MGTYTRFLYEFLAQFFAGLITILGGIGKGIGQLFNIPGYAKIIDHYKNDFSMAEWVLVVLAVIAVVVVVGMGFALIFFLIIFLNASFVLSASSWLYILLGNRANIHNSNNLSFSFSIALLILGKRRNISNEGFTTWVKTNRI